MFDSFGGPLICLPAWRRCLSLCFGLSAFVMAVFASFSVSLAFVSFLPPALLAFYGFMGFWSFLFTTSLLHSLICLPVRLLVPIHPLTFVFRSYVLTGPFVCLLWAGLEDLGSDWLWVGRRLSCVFWSQVLLSIFCHLLTLWLACWCRFTLQSCSMLAMLVLLF